MQKADRTENVRTPLIEFKKSRHKPFFLLLAAAIVLNYFYLFHGISPDQQDWYNILYGIPVINTLILSVLMAVIASQSVDMEHKGAMWNLLPTLEREYETISVKVHF